VGPITRISIVAAAIAIASLGTSADVLTTFGSPAFEAAHRHDKRDRPKGTVWVVNRDLGQLAIFDAGTGKLLKTLPVGAGAHDICISERARKAYITAETDNAVTAVDTETLAIESIPVSPLPHHLEPSHDGRTIYVSLASHPQPGVPAPGAPQVASIDTRDHSVTYMTSSDDPAARSHGVTPERHKLYVAHDTGNQLTGIDLETGDIDFTIPGIPRAEEVVASRFGDELWVSSRGEGSVKRIDLDTQAITASVFVGVQPESMMLTPTERTLVLSLRGNPTNPGGLGFVDTRSVDTATPLVQVVPFGAIGTLGDLAVMTPNGRYVFATFDRGLPPNRGGVVVVDVRTRQIVNWWEYPGEGRPHGIWYSKKAARF
jgi:DNA-binding beta-propeller fold protein YncE